MSTLTTAQHAVLRDAFCDCPGNGLPDDQHAPDGCHGLAVVAKVDEVLRPVPFKVGEWVIHLSGNLDPRKVVAVKGTYIEIALTNSTVTVPAANYRSVGS